MKTARQAVAAAAHAFRTELYKNTAREALRIEIAVDDRFFDVLAAEQTNPLESVDVIDIVLDSGPIRVRRESARTGVKSAARKLRSIP